MAWIRMPVTALRLAEGGTPVVDVYRQLGVSEATFYTWKNKYADFGVSELNQHFLFCHFELSYAITEKREPGEEEEEEEEEAGLTS